MESGAEDELDRKVGMEVLYFYNKQMVIRHHLSAEKEAANSSVSSKSETTNKPTSPA